MASSKKTSGKAGLPPGSLIHVGKVKSKTISITAIDYDSENFEEVEIHSIEEVFPYRDSKSISWININGLHDTELIEKLGVHFDIHPLLLEDILNTNHRPKFEEFENHIFITLKMLQVTNKAPLILSEQVSFILGKNWVISFQEQKGDVFNNIRVRLQNPTVNMRQRKADYLLYRLIDTVVDHYFFVTETLAEYIEKLEERVLEGNDDMILRDIQHQKRLLIKLRKIIYPLREAVSNLHKESNPFINEKTTHYLRDVYEHIIQVNETIDSHRDTMSSIMDLYLSGQSNKMNEVMKVLTIISTLFIPLTFLAGIYGMNFDNIPELHWRYSYFALLLVMVVLAILMLFYFKRKKWL